MASRGRWVAGEPDSLRSHVGERGETLEGKAEMRPALGGSDGVDLVDDHPTNRAEDLACL